MWRKIKNMESPEAGQKMILASLTMNKVKYDSSRIECEVTEVTDNLITVKANGHDHQFTQGDWEPVINRPKYRLFPSETYLDDLFEHADLRSRISVAFNFTSVDRQDFTIDQLRKAVKELGL